MFSYYLKTLTSFLILCSALNKVVLASEKTDLYPFFKGQQTQIKNPFDLRDPFKREILRSDRTKNARYGGVVQGNTFSNIPSIANVPIDRIKIVGILIGKDRRAMAKIEGDDKNTYVLKEGMTLGLDKAEIKAILPGGLVLVEKIRNVYDQDEYLETIMTLSSE